MLKASEFVPRIKSFLMAAKKLILSLVHTCWFLENLIETSVDLMDEGTTLQLPWAPVDSPKCWTASISEIFTDGDFRSHWEIGLEWMGHSLIVKVIPRESESRWMKENVTWFKVVNVLLDRTLRRGKQDQYQNGQESQRHFINIIATDDQKRS